jgi:hypothetical protein
VQSFAKGLCVQALLPEQVTHREGPRTWSRKQCRQQAIEHGHRELLLLRTGVTEAQFFLVWKRQHALQEERGIYPRELDLRA